MANRPIIVRDVPIELSQFIKFAGLTDSGGDAKQAIVDGKVQVNGTVETRRGRKLQVGDTVTLAGQSIVVALR
jgi:ribosome-associated protein